jgi:tRNA(Ile)-lysidine synthase
LRKAPFPESIPRQVLRFLGAAGVRPGDRLLLAFSGGADSLVLLHALIALRSRAGRGGRLLRITAAHLDHGVRGECSAADARAAAVLCRRWRVPLCEGRLDPGAVEDERRRQRSLEGALRVLRYRFLRDAARGCGAGRVLLAHQADDQAETVLMRAAAGKDWRSLAGIPPVRGLFLRPLLATGAEVPRARIESYARRHRLSPREDESNLDPAFARNRLRCAMLPALRTAFHPGLDGLLLRMGRAAAALAAWEDRASAAISAPGQSARVMPNALRERAAVRVLRRWLGRWPSRAQVEAYLRLDARGRGEQEVAGGTLVAGRGGVSFRRGIPARHRRRDPL